MKTPIEIYENRYNKIIDCLLVCKDPSIMERINNAIDKAWQVVLTDFYARTKDFNSKEHVMSLTNCNINVAFIKKITKEN